MYGWQTRAKAEACALNCREEKKKKEKKEAKVETWFQEENEMAKVKMSGWEIDKYKRMRDPMNAQKIVLAQLCLCLNVNLTMQSQLWPLEPTTIVHYSHSDICTNKNKLPK